MHPETGETEKGARYNDDTGGCWQQERETRELWPPFHCFLPESAARSL